MSEPFSKPRDLTKVDVFRAEGAELAALAAQQREAYATRSGSGGHPNPEFMFARLETFIKAAITHVQEAPVEEPPPNPEPLPPKVGEKPPTQGKK